MTLWTAPPDDRRHAVDHHSRDAAGRRLAGGAGDKAVTRILGALLGVVMLALLAGAVGWL
jgi:hypothetical protein